MEFLPAWIPELNPTEAIWLCLPQDYIGHQVFDSLAAIELAKDWRSDRSLRRLEALLCVAGAKNSFIVSGNGDVIEPEDDIMAIGSGGPYAQAAARALVQNTDLDARTAVERSLNIAADICIYTNRNLTIEELRS